MIRILISDDDEMLLLLELIVILTTVSFTSLPQALSSSSNLPTSNLTSSSSKSVTFSPTSDCTLDMSRNKPVDFLQLFLGDEILQRMMDEMNSMTHSFICITMISTVFTMNWIAH